MAGRRRLVRLLAIACALLGAIAPTTASARSALRAQVPSLDFQGCGAGTDPAVQCATAQVPRDYGNPGGKQIMLFLAKSPATDPAHRIGSLFINFGGPGGTAADIFEALGSGLFPALNERYDIIAMDPRGVGQSSPSIDCKANQETQGIYSQPFATPDNLDVGALIRRDTRYIARCVSLNRGILKYVSTANVARDIDLLRQALGERKITYFGFSYGTFLGATYASMFPTHYARMVLDGPVDANAYINDPLRNLSAQTTGFERALGRFLQACARDQTACVDFGGDDPWDAYDQLLARLDQTPIPAAGADPRPVDGDVARAATAGLLYNKGNWPFLAQALADAEQGDGTRLRRAADVLFYGRNDDGTYDPILDRYFTIGAVEQRYARNVPTYLEAGRRSWDEHEHFYFNNGYVELNYGLYPFRARDAFRGPFRIPASSPTPLVVATTYDPATPYHGALNLVGELRNARLLTMRGDGHTAYPGNSACIDAAVEAYINDGTLPAPGTQCKQEVPFAASAAVAAAARAMAVPAMVSLGHNVKPLQTLRVR